MLGFLVFRWLRDFLAMSNKNLFYNSRSNTDKSEYNVWVVNNTTEGNADMWSKINLTENSDAASQSTE